MILFSDWLIGEILASYWSIGKSDTPNEPCIYNNRKACTKHAGYQFCATLTAANNVTSNHMVNGVLSHWQQLGINQILIQTICHLSN